MGIRQGRRPVLDAPVHQQLVDVLRDILSTTPRFAKLDELIAQLKTPTLKTRTAISDLTRGNRIPTEVELREVVVACRPSAWPQVQRLLAAAQAEATHRAVAAPPKLADHIATGPSANWPIVSEFDDWEGLGVHKPLTRLRNGDDLSGRLARSGLPAYVLRETDLAPNGLRATLTTASSGSSTRFVLITGDSTAGKTRTAVEAIRAVLPTWRLILPHSAMDLKAILDLHLEMRHVVVWCDEVQEMLREPVGLAQIRRLLAAPSGPIVLMATLRADREEALRGTAEWSLLDRRAERFLIRRRPHRNEFERELVRARELSDPWIVEAVARIGEQYGIAEWIAAGPQLLRNLDRGRTSPPRSVERLGAAIVDAAIDFNRIGYDGLIPVDALREACTLYLTRPTTVYPQRRLTSH